MSFGISAAAWGAIGAIGSVAIGASASRRAGQVQADAANQANQTQWDIYNQNRTDMAPWRTAGEGALGQLTEGLKPGGTFNRDFTMADYQKDPGYDFRMAEGAKALERSRAGRGALYGGAAAKAMTRYGQDYASGEFTNAFNRYMVQRNAQYNRLAGVSGTGQTATEQLGNQGIGVARDTGNNLMGAANARASGYMGGANALSNGVSQWLRYNQGNSTPWWAQQPQYGGGGIDWNTDSGMG